MLLSVIIPTKNRYNTLFNVIDTILRFDRNDEIEIVIQDNTDDNELALKFVNERINYSNLRYFYDSRNLSVIENSDLAVKNSRGEYVCFIGDDDGVMPYIVDVVKWMRRINIKAIKSSKPYYFWPDQKSSFISNDVSGNLKFKSFDYSIKKMSTKKGLLDTLKKGGTTMELLPCLYHGIVEKETLSKIYEKCNSYFPGPSPDMANAIALTQFIDEYVHLDFPVVISGKSAKSTGGQGILHQHINRIEEVAHLPKTTSENWNEKIPKYWTGPTIWAESVIKALENCNNHKLLKQFNFDYLYAAIYVYYGKHLNEIFDDFKFKRSNISFYRSYLKVFNLRVYSFIDNRVNISTTKLKNVGNISEAVELLDRKIIVDKLVFNLNA